MLLALFPVVGCLSRRGNPGRDHVGALTENNKQVTAVLSTLKDHGVQEQDIQTTQLSINPVFERQDLNDTHPPKIDGYRVQNGPSAKLRDIQGAGAAIDAAVQAGGDAAHIESISFSFADPSRLLVEARKQAIDDAKDRAHQLTDGLDVALGNVILIYESDLSSGPTTQEFASPKICGNHSSPTSGGQGFPSSRCRL